AIKNLEKDIKDSNAKIQIDEHLPTVSGDRILLEMIMLNLINNGIKYTKQDHQPEIKISSVETPSEFHIKVKDNGIGIDKKCQPKIFDLFARMVTDKDYPGSGIGLSIAQKATMYHGGKIWVESNLNEGSEFVFSITKYKSVNT
ncbi:MAG: ATP-binding protein, partial [Gammaproteobacteria bacterium]